MHRKTPACRVHSRLLAEELRVLQDVLERVEHRGILDGGGHRLVQAVGDTPHGLPQDLARTGLRQRRHHVDLLENRHRADVFRTRSTSSWVIPSVEAPVLSTTKPRGTWPLSSSATPITAHSATEGWSASTASIDPVDNRCPATLITSSVRPITNR